MKNPFHAHKKNAYIERATVIESSDLFLPTLRTHMGSIVNAEASLARSQDAIDMGVSISVMY